MEEYIQMLVTSGYDRRQTKEAIVSGIRGWKSKIRRREEEGKNFYRTAASTLSSRYKKKLTAKTNWYKGSGDMNTRKRKYEMDEEELKDLSGDEANAPLLQPSDDDRERDDGTEGVDAADEDLQGAAHKVSPRPWRAYGRRGRRPQSVWTHPIPQLVRGVC